MRLSWKAKEIKSACSRGITASALKFGGYLPHLGSRLTPFSGVHHLVSRCPTLSSAKRAPLIPHHRTNRKSPMYSATYTDFPDFQARSRLDISSNSYTIGYEDFSRAQPAGKFFMVVRVLNSRGRDAKSCVSSLRIEGPARLLLCLGRANRIRPFSPICSAKDICIEAEA